jgi:GNAT superfamily N-acetyltransferase
MATWASYEPKEPHCHFGPFGVLPERQGQGIGSRLLEYLCQQVDQRDQPCYLETETFKNVRLYESFGFSVVREVPILELPTWLMWRPSQSERSA